MVGEGADFRVGKIFHAAVRDLALNSATWETLEIFLKTFLREWASDQKEGSMRAVQTLKLWNKSRWKKRFAA